MESVKRNGNRFESFAENLWSRRQVVNGQRLKVKDQRSIIWYLDGGGVVLGGDGGGRDVGLQRGYGRLR